ncbi:hypothetical protein EDB81DRAFT_83299 [Dactylonectria macrodidyma]|uniref:Transmembrane protein n=1 Tax=Dactylonectria macrodidyma TaxID=307937 RepID=A0A9P9EG97_9HYPO|nr:hypothetical protein EDB81DRAFT_83299 [Dactylonectria macrodidyma]
MSSIIEKTNESSQPSGKGHEHHVPVHKILVDLVELLPAAPSVWIMTGYMNQLYKATRPPDTVCALRTWSLVQLLQLQLPFELPRNQLTWLKTSRVDSLVCPSRWMLLIACIIFGCSAASFLRRRQRHDPYQPYIFAVCVASSTVAGEVTGASAGYIMLVHVSWAVCVAMLVSAVGLRVHGCGHP